MKTLIKSISNFRDFSDIKTITNVKVKKGLIFRSAALYTIKDEDKNAFNNLKIDNIIDLRFPSEQKDHPDYIGSSKLTLVSYIKGMDGFDKNDLQKMLKKATQDDYQKVYDLFIQLYSNIKDNDAIKETLKSLDNHESFLFHCSGGKDRTGVIAFILMMMFGFSLEDAYNEYVLTAKFRRKERRKLILFSLIKGITKWGRKILLLAYSDPKDELFNLLISSIYDNYKNIYDFLEKEYNITEEKIKDYKEYYLEK